MAEQIKRQIVLTPELQELLGEVDVKVEADGLNVEIMDSDKFSMFRSGSARIVPDAEPAFAKIAAILNKVPNTIDVVGHTDSKPFSNSATAYTNWELSADRANAARRLLERSGISSDRITNVQGRADRDLKTPDDPSGPSNRRITLKVKFPVSATVNAGEDPGALERMMNEPPQQAAQPTAAPPPAAARQAPPPTPRAPARTLSPQQILENQKKQEKKPVQLPKSAPPSENPEYMESDKIFPEIPVLGPPSPFSSF